MCFEFEFSLDRNKRAPCRATAIEISARRHDVCRGMRSVKKKLLQPASRSLLRSVGGSIRTHNCFPGVNFSELNSLPPRLMFLRCKILPVSSPEECCINLERYPRTLETYYLALGTLSFLELHRGYRRPSYIKDRDRMLLVSKWRI